MKADKGKKFAKGGCATKAEAKSIAKKEVSGHEKSMHKMKKGGMCGAKKYARGGGIEVRGKTKGKII
jgi:hypothetical protein